MADVKWSTLFPKTGGSGRGGAFTGKVLTAAMSPYTVSAGDRLVVTQTDQPLVIDPGNLKDDEAFQVIDASRTFDKNPVTIKGDKLTIQIVGAGNDLILDMIGAGNLWEFIANGGQLLVADSPGYTGELPAGGGSAPAAITVDSALSMDSDNPVQNKVINAALNEKADLVDGKVPASQLPAATTGGGAFSFTTVAQNSSRAEESFDVSPGECFVVNMVEPVAGTVTINLPDPFDAAGPVRVMRRGGRPAVDMNGSDQTDVIVKAKDGTKLVGTWDDFDGEGQQIALSAPGEYVELSPIILPAPDGAAWLIAGSGYSESDSTRITRVSGDVTARFGYVMQCERECTITMPRLDPDGEPITILNGARMYDPQMGYDNLVIKIAFGRDSEDPDRYTTDYVWGVFRGKQFALNVSGRDDIQLTKAGEWVTFTPTAGGWLINGATLP